MSAPASLAPTPILAAAAAAPWVTARALLAGRTALVVVAPHPDDETLGCGALLHDAAALGAPCRVICLTDGSASHRASRAWGPDRIARARRAELTAALAMLAPRAQVSWLGYRDCGLPGAGEEARLCAGRIAAALPPGALMAAAWEGDPHCDHERGARLAALACAGRQDLRLLSYPVWGRFDPAARPPPALVVEATAAARRAKRRALACHATQMTRLIDDDAEGFVMSPEHQAHFLDHPEILLAP